MGRPPPKEAFAQCAPAQQALFKCKAGLGLLPRQCYPTSGYDGECDGAEFELKKCLAYVVDGSSAAVLYGASNDFKAKAQANKRLQKQLRQFNEPCTP